MIKWWSLKDIIAQKILFRVKKGSLMTRSVKVQTSKNLLQNSNCYIIINLPYRQLCHVVKKEFSHGLNCSAVQVCYFFWYVQSIWIVIQDHILLSLLILVKMYRTSSVISCCLFWLLLSLFGLKHHTYSMSTGGVYDINGKDSVRLYKSLFKSWTINPFKYVDS